MGNVLPEFVTEEGYLDERRLSMAAITDDGTTVFTKSSLEAALHAYGEDQVLQAVSAGLSKSQVEAIGARHFTLTYQTDPAKTTGAGYPFDKALAISAVEVVEGRSRELTRKRRRPSSYRLLGIPVRRDCGTLRHERERSADLRARFSIAGGRAILTGCGR